MIPDNVEKIIITKEDYDRNVEQLLYGKVNAELEVERLNNIINKIFSFCKTQQEKCFDVVAEQCYSEIMYLIEDELKGSDKE